MGSTIKAKHWCTMHHHLPKSDFRTYPRGGTPPTRGPGGVLPFCVWRAALGSELPHKYHICWENLPICIFFHAEKITQPPFPTHVTKFKTSKTALFFCPATSNFAQTT